MQDVILRQNIEHLFYIITFYSVLSMSNLHAYFQGLEDKLFMAGMQSPTGSLISG